VRRIGYLAKGEFNEAASHHSGLCVGTNDSCRRVRRQLRDGSEYGTQPGFVVANGNTPCAGHGAFGAFGKDNNFAGGANGCQTGINNSTLCGNRQGNLP